MGSLCLACLCGLTRGAACASATGGEPLDVDVAHVGGPERAAVGLGDGGLRDAGTRERRPLDLGVRHAHRRGGRGAAILRGHRRERLLQLPSLAPVDLGPLLEVREVALGEDGGDSLRRLSLGVGDRAR